MAETMRTFPRATKRRLATTRSLGEKLQEIAFIDAHELHAFSVLADMVLERLHRQQEQQKA